MTNGKDPPGGIVRPDDDPDQPIPELADLIEPALPLFEMHVQNRIQRRLFGAHVVGHAFLTPFLVMMEFLRLVFEMLGRVDDSNGRSDE